MLGYQTEQEDCKGVTTPLPSRYKIAGSQYSSDPRKTAADPELNEKSQFCQADSPRHRNMLSIQFSRVISFFHWIGTNNDLIAKSWCLDPPGLEKGHSQLKPERQKGAGDRGTHQC